MAFNLNHPMNAETACTRPVEQVTGSHMFRIMGYSLDKDIGKGKFLESTIFSVAGYDWCVKYYPDGCNEAGDGDISLFLCLKTKAEGVKAQVSFTVLHHSGKYSPITATTEMRIFKSVNNLDNCGFKSFVKKQKIGSYLKDDTLVIKCVVDVFKVLPVRPVKPVTVPPGNMQQQLGLLLETKTGADVTFDVNGKAFSAHKCILAARSPVFAAQFFGAMKEDSDRIIKIEEIEAPVFDALLHFVYNDSLPGFEETNKSVGKQETESMARHLLVAADKYDLGRLRTICENILCGSVDMNNVVTLLSLAERHSCNHLKNECLRLLASPGILGRVAETEDFQHLLCCHQFIGKDQLLDKKQYHSLLPDVAVVFWLFLTVVFVTFIWPGLIFDDNIPT